MRPFFHLSDTDATLGLARFELEQKLEDGKIDKPLDLDRIDSLARELRMALRWIANLEADIEALKRRTWWSMLMELFRRN